MKPVERDPEKLTVTERADLARRDWRARREGEFPFVSDVARPADYVDAFARGTVVFDRDVRNYSFHTVVIPAGTIVTPRLNARGDDVLPYNFSFATIVVDPPGGEVTFRGCNLFGATLPPRADVQDCLVAPSPAIAAARLADMRADTERA